MSALTWSSSPKLSAQPRMEQGTSQNIFLNRRRPLADAVLALERRHGIAITYEDPPYRFVDQLVNDSLAGRPASFVPRGGPFSFEYVLPARPSDKAMKPVLAAMLHKYSATGYAGKFELSQTGTMLHVIPISRRAEDGQEVPYEAILSTQLSFAATGVEKSAFDALSGLTQDLQRATGVSVLLGTVPTNLLTTTKVVDWTGSASARTELVRILMLTGQPLSWLLFYDPNAPGMFVLNIHLL